MNLLFPVLTIFGGLIAASSILIARKPDAKEVFDKIAPYQGMVGIGMLVAGVLWFLRVLPHAGTLLSAAPVAGAVTIATVATTLLVGFFLGYALLDRFVLSKSAAASEKGASALAKIATVQAPLGLANAALGAACILL